MYTVKNKFCFVVYTNNKKQLRRLCRQDMSVIPTKMFRRIHHREDMSYLSDRYTVPKGALNCQDSFQLSFGTTDIIQSDINSSFLDIFDMQI